MIIEKNSEWSINGQRVIVQEVNRKGRGYTVVYATWVNDDAGGVYRISRTSFVNIAKPLNVAEAA